MAETTVAIPTNDLLTVPTIDISMLLANIGDVQHRQTADERSLKHWHQVSSSQSSSSLTIECPTDERSGELTDNLTRIIYTVLMPLVCLLGAFGASISLYIFTRRQMRSSLNTYLAALSFFDLILLLMSILIYPSMNLCLQKGHTGIICHFFWNSSLVTYPISLMAQMASVWTCVAITVDRFLAVQYPLHMRAWCTPSRAKCILFFVVVVTVLYKMPSFFELTLDECSRLRTTELRKHPFYIIIYNTYGYLLLLLVIPFIVIIILNIFVILAVRKANKQRQQMRMVMRRRSVSGSISVRKHSRWLPGPSSNGHTTNGSLVVANGQLISVAEPSLPAITQSISMEIDSRCTKMATITITAFLICNVLAGMNNVIEAFELSVPLETYRIPIGNLLVCVNSATNILIYSIFGRRFRNMCAALLCPCPCWAYKWGRNCNSLLRTNMTNV